MAATLSAWVGRQLALSLHLRIGRTPMTGWLGMLRPTSFSAVTDSWYQWQDDETPGLRINSLAFCTVSKWGIPTGDLSLGSSLVTLTRKVRLTPGWENGATQESFSWYGAYASRERLTGASGRPTDKRKKNEWMNEKSEMNERKDWMNEWIRDKTSVLEQQLLCIS